MTKVCQKCKATLKASDFHKGAKWCKACCSSYAKEYNASPVGMEVKRKARERRSKEVPFYWKEYYKRHKEQDKEKKLMSAYGLSIEEYRSMLSLQEDKCAVCGVIMEKPHVDHCHKTDLVRGLLCRDCNIGIGMFRDNPVVLLRAATYLNQHKMGKGGM